MMLEVDWPLSASPISVIRAIINLEPTGKQEAHQLVDPSETLRCQLKFW